MKIEQTFLCLNCDEIFSESCKQCPSCASTYLVPLAKFLPPLNYNGVLIRTFPVPYPRLEYRANRLRRRTDVR